MGTVRDASCSKTSGCCFLRARTRCKHYAGKCTVNVEIHPNDWVSRRLRGVRALSRKVVRRGALAAASIVASGLGALLVVPTAGHADDTQSSTVNDSAEGWYSSQVPLSTCALPSGCAPAPA